MLSALSDILTVKYAAKQCFELTLVRHLLSIIATWYIVVLVNGKLISGTQEVHVVTMHTTWIALSKSATNQ